jgi:serine/threonine-protein kinase
MGGPVFGKYEIQKRLAVGGMGEVFLARQTGIPGFERWAILKSLLPDMAEQQSAIDEFLDEARVAATLNHPNVISIFEVGLWEGTYFIAMEYVDGDNLSGLRRAALSVGNAMPFPLIAKVIKDAAEGLDHAHRALDLSGKPLSIVHRDVSPQNIMVRRDGVTKVVDFGIARAANRSTRTKTGTTKGKIAYMPPEQLRGHEVDGRSDQYALGVVLWELCANKRLFVGDTDVDIINAVLSKDIESPRVTEPEVPELLEGICMKMLSRDPDQRYASCAHAAADLGRYLELEAPGLGTLEVSAFVCEALDAVREKEKANKPNENFVIDLKGGRPDTGPVNSERSLSSGAMASAQSGNSSNSIKRPPVVVANPPPLVTPARAGVVALLGILAAVGLYEATKSPPVAPVVDVVKQPDVPKLPEAKVVPRPEKGALYVESPKGASVEVDGKMWSVPAPVELSGLQPGPHKIKLTLENGAALAEVTSEVAGGKLHVESTPPGAFVKVDGAALGAAPLDTQALLVGPHTIDLELQGYVTAHVQATAKGGATEPVAATLEKEKVASHVGTHTTVPATTGTTGTAPPPEVKPDGPAFGFLTLDTEPWAQVEIDGELYGSTPLFKKKLPAGTHQVKLVNDGANIKVSRSITVKKDEALKLVWQLP